MPHAGIVKAERFSTLFLAAGDEFVADEHLTEAANVQIDRGGQLIPRRGLKLAPTQPPGMLATDDPFLVEVVGTFDYLIAVVKDRGPFYGNYTAANTVTWTAVPLPATVDPLTVIWAVEYGGLVYFSFSDFDGELVSWDPANPATVGTAIDLSGPLGGVVPGDAIAVFKDRVWIAGGGSTQRRNRLAWSEIGNPASWLSTSFIDVGEPDDWIQRIVPYSGQLVIFKQESIWLLTVQGAPANWILRQVSSEFGLTSVNGVVEMEGKLFFTSYESVISTDLTNFTPVSEPIGNLLEAPFTKDGDTWGRPTSGTVYWDAAIRFEDGIIFVLGFESLTGGTGRDYTFLYRPRTQSWTEIVWPSGIATRPSLSSALVNEFGEYIFGDVAGGRILQSDRTLFSDLTFDYNIVIATKAYDFGRPDKMKRVKYIGVRLESEADAQFTATLDMVADDRSASVNFVVAAGQRYRYYKLPGPGFCRTLKLKLTIPKAKGVVFKGFELHVHEKAKVIETAIH